MPAKKKVTRDLIINAAFSILRNDGLKAVNARNIAKKLNCSTQPIYHEFKGMDELKKELEKQAGECHALEVQKYIAKSLYTRYKAYGLGFIRLAKEEKEVFRYLYMTETDDGKQPYVDVNLPEILQILCDEYGYSMETAQKFHQDMTFYSLGLALNTNVGAIDLEDDEISRRLQNEFIALTKIYGSPPKKPQIVEN